MSSKDGNGLVEGPLTHLKDDTIPNTVVKSRLQSGGLLCFGFFFGVDGDAFKGGDAFCKALFAVAEFGITTLRAVCQTCRCNVIVI